MMTINLPTGAAVRKAGITLSGSNLENPTSVGEVYGFEDGHFELSLGCYPAEGATLKIDFDDDASIEDGVRPLAAFLENRHGGVRVEIGTVSISQKIGDIRFLGLPTFEARLIF